MSELIPPLLCGPDAPAAAMLVNLGTSLGKAHANPEPHGEAYAVVPDGYEVQALPRLDLPVHPKALVRLRDAASFIRFVADHATRDSRIYAQLDPARFLAVLDDFGCDGAVLGMKDQAAWREYRADFAVPASREWLLWNGGNRKPMGQLAFAEFLQDNLPDVKTPDGATLLEMALQFEAVQSGTFVATQRLQDGSHNLQWRAENNASGSVKLPEMIELAIPVFENEPADAVHARLRYRVKDGTLTIWYELVRPHKVLEAAFRRTWDRIANETGTPILLGMPE